MLRTSWSRAVEPFDCFIFWGNKVPGHLERRTFSFNLKSFTYLGGDGGRYLADILEFEPSTGEWNHIGQMRRARGYHAVSTIFYEEIKIYC